MEENNYKGWVSLYRKFTNWHWYKNANVKSVFIHLLLNANHKNETWKNITILRGQILTSREHLANDLGLSVQQVRTCLSKLESTNEIKIETTNRYTLITIINYDKYQRNFIDEQATNKITDNSTDKVTNEITDNSTNNKNVESVENTGKEKQDTQEITSNSTDKATNKTTENITIKLTTNNNNINNTNNNILLNYTKLNLLFNYLIYKEQKFENLNEGDRSAITTILKRLELYITSTNYIPEDKLLEIKIQYWVIMEIYLSPYKVYINDLSRINFLFRFLKTKKYVSYDSDEELRKFVGYFIKSLREELKKDSN